MNNINHHTIEVTQNDVTLVNLNSPVIDNPSNGDPENSKKDFDIDISGVTRVTSVTANDGVACSGNRVTNRAVTTVTRLEQTGKAHKSPSFKMMGYNFWFLPCILCPVVGFPSVALRINHPNFVNTSITNFES